MSSSQTKSDSRIYVGNLPPDIKSRDLEDLFYKYGKIKFVDLKNRKGPPFAFVEFDDSRDAEDAVKGRDGYNFDGYRIRVEFQKGSRGGSRASSSYRGGGGAPPRRSDYRIQVSGLPPTGSWQDLKDHMREAGQVCYADVFKDGTGVVEFIYYDDMKYAVKKLDDTKFRSHEGETSYIRIREDSSRRRSSSRSRSRSRSTSAKRRERQSPTYSPDRRSRSRSRSRRSDDDYDRKKRSSRKYSPSRSRSRSPSHSRSRSRSRGGSRSRSRSVASRSRSNSRHRSRSNSRKRDSSVPPVPVAADTATNGNGLDSPSVKRRAESPGGEQKRVRRSASQESEPNNNGHDQENNNGTSELPQSESQQPIDE